MIFLQKTMAKIEMQADNNMQSLISGFSDMPLHDLESFISQLNALAIRKRIADKGKRDKSLLLKINQAILPEEAMERYIELQEKMEVENLTDVEYQELLAFVVQEEKVRNKRFQYLLELSQLRGISLAELMNSLGLNALNNA
jgi:hypothetical protein